MRFLLTMSAIVLTLNSQAQSTDYFAEGKKAQTAKNYTLAVDHFKKAAAQKPTDGAAWYELGWSYNELAKYKEATEALRKAKEYWKDTPKVYYESGYANDYLNKTEDAVRDYNKCIELDEEYSGAYRQLANIYFEVDKDYEKALKLYNQYVNYSRESDIISKTWYRKGYCENELAQYEDAVMSLNKAVAVDSKFTAAYDELGYANYKLEKTDEAIEAYQTSQQLDATSSTPCSGLGDIYRFLKKMPEQAFEYYKKGTELNAKSQNSFFGVGWCYNEQGKYTEAITYLKKAIALNDKFASSFTELGYAYYGLKKYDEALVELDKSLKLAESNTAYYYTGLCYINKNQKAKAQDIYKKMLDLNLADAGSLLAKINAM